MFSEVVGGILAVSSIDDLVPDSWQTVDCRSLLDGPGNAYSEIQRLRTEVERLVGEGSAVCLQCDYGRSRSNFIAAHVLENSFGFSWEEALREVGRRHPESRINPSLCSEGRGPGSAGKSPTSDRVMRVAISGGNGYLGKRLRTELTGASVVTLSLCRRELGEYLEPNSSLDRVLTDNGITDVIHLAHPKPYNDYENLGAALAQLSRLVEVCLRRNISLHHVSGWVVFDGSTEPEVIETSLRRPHSLYGQTKLLQEELIEMQRANAGLSARIYRLPGILESGDRAPRFLRYFADSIRNANPIRVHRYLNGSAVVPLGPPEPLVRSLASSIVDLHSEQLLVHVVDGAASVSVDAIAHNVARQSGSAVLPVDVDMMRFTGIFNSNINCPRPPVDKTAGLMEQCNAIVYGLVGDARNAQ